MTDHSRKGPSEEGRKQKAPLRGPDAVVMEAFDQALRAESSGDIREFIKLLSDFEGLVSLAVEESRLQATRLAETQNELVQAVGSVRDMVSTTASVTRKMDLRGLSTNADVGSVAQGVALLARILKDLHSLSVTAAAAIESQANTSRDLICLVGEAAKASVYLVGKTATLASTVRAALPDHCPTGLVEAELEWLAKELQQVLPTFRPGLRGEAATARDATESQMPAQSETPN